MKHFRAGFLISLAVLLSDCALFTEGSEGPPPLLTALPRDLSAPETLLVDASNQLGFALLREARRPAPDSNLFLSPLSAAMALGMTLNGAAGTTLDSMRLALRLGSAPLAEINAGYRSLLDLLRGLDKSSEFQIANSIWADSGYPFFPAFLDVGRSSFDAEVQTLDLQAPASVGTINTWVHDKTKGKIPTILDQIRSDEVLFLINAIYFKGQWRLGFDPKLTRAAPFHAADGSVQSVATMSGAAKPRGLGATASAELIELLYGNGAFAMTIVLPRPGHTLGELVEGLDAARFAEWTAGIHESEFGLLLPKFRLDYKRELKDDLSALGMRIAFDGEQADFSGMADISQQRLFLTRVTQKTFVDVNEEGTEAAAATSVGVGTTSAPATLAVDRPFLFLIRERLSGTIFFMGQLNRIP
jgi:serine protease inhibitor